MTFADKLIRLRKINGMSQEDLADKLGVSRQAISKWEGLLSVPDLQNVLKISELFGVTTDYLLKDNVGEDGKFGGEAALRAERTVAKESAPSRAEESGTENDAVGEEGAPAVTTVSAKTESAARKQVSCDKAFSIAAGVLLLATPVATILNLFLGNAVRIEGGLSTALTIISLISAIAAGILTILSAKNAKLLGVAFCMLLVQGAISAANSVLKTTEDMTAIFNLVGGGVNIVFAVLAVSCFYSEKRSKALKYALMILPCVGAVYSVVFKAFFYDYSGTSSTTMAFGFGYVAYVLMSAVLFRENGCEKKRSENAGLAAIMFLSLSISLSVLYLLVSIVLAPAGEVVTALYVYGYVALYVAGFVMLPWIACYTPKRTAVGGEAPKGYVNIAKHIVLTAVTALVWHYIWVYSTSDHLNGCEEGKKVRASSELLRYIFIPFYYIYWFNKHGRQISRKEESRGESCGRLNKGMIVLACLVPFVASVVMQNRINALVLAGAEAEKVADA